MNLKLFLISVLVILEAVFFILIVMLLIKSSVTPSTSKNSTSGSTTPGSPGGLQKFKRVIYVGYWLEDKTIPQLVKEWKKANITHVLLTFIVQPDITKPLSTAYSMSNAFNELSIDNQNLLLENFKIGVSYGGASEMPSPYSNTFLLSNAYYFQNPAKLAQDLVDLCGPKLNQYYDLDIEFINGNYQETVDFLGQVCQNLKKINPNCEISHAPQTPYFTPGFGDVYNLLYQTYAPYFDWFNIQYYNNGPSNTYNEIFINSNETDFPNVAVAQLIESGIHPSYIVVGKPVNSTEGSAGGFVDLTTLADYFLTAMSDSKLMNWGQLGGAMIWYYNTQQESIDNQNIMNFMSTISKS